MPPPAIPARAASRVLWQWKHPEFLHVCKVSASERPTHGTSLPMPMPGRFNVIHDTMNPPNDEQVEQTRMHFATVPVNISRM